MANKLRDIFTKKPLERKVHLEFNDKNEYDNFIKSIKKVSEEGCTVEVSGVKSIRETIGNGTVNYSNESSENIVKSIVGPSAEPVKVMLNTDFGEEEIIINRILVSDGFILITDIGNVIKFIIKSNIKNNESKFSYTIEQKKAKDLKELTHCISLALAFCKYIFKNEDELKRIKSKDDYAEITNIKGVIDHFDNSLRIFKHLDFLNDKFNLNIKPLEFDEYNDFNDVEELYYSLKGTPIRSTERFNSLKTSSNDITEKKKKDMLGKKVNLTFPGEIIFSIMGRDIKLFSANLLCNAIVEKVEETDENMLDIYLKPSEDNTMYYSFSAYETPDEANEGLKNILDNIGIYYNALTINQLIESNYAK